MIEELLRGGVTSTELRVEQSAHAALRKETPDPDFGGEPARIEYAISERP